MTLEPPRPTIHWVSPLPPAETDIAHYTARILPALSEKAEVILWTDAEEWDLGLEKFCKVRHFDPDTVLPRDFTKARSGNGSEALFVNIGNSWVYHAGLLRLVQRIPSIVVLHDLAIQELMIESVEYDEWDAPSYLTGMEKWYGEGGLNAAQACLSYADKGARISTTMPGFELVLEKALAVLTHTELAHEAIQDSMPHLSCKRLPLPFPIGPEPSPQRPSTGPLRLLQFGWIGPNRRLEQVLDALADMPEDFDYQLDVMGEIWNPSVIYDKIAALNLAQRVRLHGFVSEPVLEDALRQAHLVLNLRYPSMGEASGSQLRIWNAAAPSAVTREGWYATLPKDVVYFIDQKQEAAQLKALLLELAADRDAGKVVGSAGRSYFAAHHDPELYAQALAALAEDTVLHSNRILAARSISERRHARSMHPNLQARMKTALIER